VETGRDGRTGTRTRDEPAKWKETKTVQNDEISGKIIFFSFSVKKKLFFFLIIEMRTLQLDLLLKVRVKKARKAH
jgi:hypothetical protein